MDRLRAALQGTLDPADAVRARAEREEKELSRHDGFAPALLDIVMNPEEDFGVRQAAASAFGRYTEAYWSAADIVHFGNSAQRSLSREPYPYCIPSQDRRAVAGLIVDAVTLTPERLARQLRPALDTIFEREPNEGGALLVEALLDRANSTMDPYSRPAVLTAALRGLLSILRKIRAMNTSFAKLEDPDRREELMKQLNPDPAVPFLARLWVCFHRLARWVERTPGSPDGVLEDGIGLVAACFCVYSVLNLTTPSKEGYENWLREFTRFLGHRNGALMVPLGEFAEPGPLERMLQSLCAALTGMLDRAGDTDVRVLNATLDLLEDMPLEPRFDAAASVAMTLLCTSERVAAQTTMDTILGRPTSVLDSVIFPALRLRDDERELFEQDPEEFIRREVETDAGGGRRLPASRLLATLFKRDDATLRRALESLRSAERGDDIWFQCLVVTRLPHHVVEKIEERPFLRDFIEAVVLPELAGYRGVHDPLAKAGCLLLIYRLQHHLSAAELGSLFPLVIAYLDNASPALCTLASLCLGEMLALRVVDGPPTRPLPREQVLAALPDILGKLFGLLVPEGGEAFLNEYPMLSLVRVLTFSGSEGSAPYLAGLMTHLGALLERVARSSPAHPGLVHFLFEALALLTRHVRESGPAAAEPWEDMLLAHLESAVRRDDIPADDFGSTGGEPAAGPGARAELYPYVFTLLTDLLEMHRAFRPESPPRHADTYTYLLEWAVTPVLWETKANRMPLAMSLRSALRLAGCWDVVRERLAPRVLGILQLQFRTFKLGDVVNLEPAVVLSCGLADAVQERDEMGDVFLEGFKAVLASQQNRSAAGHDSVIIARLSAYMAYLFGWEGFREAMDSLRPGMAVEMLAGVVIPHGPRLAAYPRRREAVLGLVRLLREAPVFWVDAHGARAEDGALVGKRGETAWIDLLRTCLLITTSIIRRDRGVSPAEAADLRTLDIERRHSQGVSNCAVMFSVVHEASGGGGEDLEGQLSTPRLCKTILDTLWELRMSRPIKLLARMELAQSDIGLRGMMAQVSLTGTREEEEGAEGPSECAATD